RGRVPTQPAYGESMPIRDLPEAEIDRIYGDCLPRTPDDLATLMVGYPGRWWIAGGWTFQASTGSARPHGDLDPSITRSEISLLRSHLAGQLDLWAADQGTLSVLIPGDDVTLSPTCENIWARDGGSNPWQYDIILMDGDADRWIFKRDSTISLPWDEIVWQRDQIPYLRPEIQLLHKAAGLRPKDVRDFEVAAPLLDDRARTWLREGIERVH